MVGAGVIGLCVAYSLRQRGHEVTVLDRSEAGAGASSGNAGWIIPSLSHPLPMPGLTTTAIKWMLSADSPLYMHPRADADFLRWLWRFWRSCTPQAYERGVRITAELNRQTLWLYSRLRADGVQMEFHDHGLLLVHRDPGSAHADLQDFEQLAEFGFSVPEFLEHKQLAEAEPALGAGDRVALLLNEPYVRPESLIRGLVAYLSSHGVEIRSHQNVLRIERSDTGKPQVVLESAGSIIGDVAIIAAGVWSGRLARQLGLRLPIQAGKGYHVDYSPAPISLRHAINFVDEKIVVSPFQGVTRVTGMMEVADPNDARILSGRVAGIARGTARAIPGWPASVDGAAVWSGPRPIVADGLPVIGPVPGAPDIFLATGHHMSGVTLAPVTGELIADMIETHRVPELVRPFDPARFA